MNKSQALVFDFDGVIAQTLELAIQIANQSAKKIGFQPRPGLNIEKLRGLNTRQIFKALGIPLLKVPLAVKIITEGLRTKIHLAKVTPGIKAAIKKLHQKGFKMGILSSNSEENIRKFLKKNKLEYFDFIYSGGKYFGKDQAVKNILKNLGLKKEEVIYIGDETRDIEAAKKAGVKIIAVS